MALGEHEDADGSEPSFAPLSQQVKGIASLLEEKSSVPLVQKQLALIQDLQTDEW